MNHDMSVEEHVMNAERLEHLMLQDVSIIPPDSVIKTFPRLKGEKIDFVLAQDREGLMINSFILRRGEWAKFFLDVWFDPIYRNYNFQRAERHALEHIVQYVQSCTRTQKRRAGLTNIIDGTAPSSQNSVLYLRTRSTQL